MTAQEPIEVRVSQPEADIAVSDAERIAEARHPEVMAEFTMVQAGFSGISSDVSDFHSGVMGRMFEAETPGTRDT
ncbi:hypothetical protein [Nocardia rhamnosiphila]